MGSRGALFEGVQGWRYCDCWVRVGVRVRVGLKMKTSDMC